MVIRTTIHREGFTGPCTKHTSVTRAPESGYYFCGVCWCQKSSLAAKLGFIANQLLDQPQLGCMVEVWSICGEKFKLVDPSCPTSVVTHASGSDFFDALYRSENPGKWNHVDRSRVLPGRDRDRFHSTTKKLAKIFSTRSYDLSKTRPPRFSKIATFSKNLGFDF